jgi:hypothetical protein
VGAAQPSTGAASHCHGHTHADYHAVDYASDHAAGYHDDDPATVRAADAAVYTALLHQQYDPDPFTLAAATAGAGPVAHVGAPG